LDVNLTGAFAANIGLMQQPKTDYLPIITQIATTFLTAAVTLAAVFLTQHLASKSAAKKHAKEEKEKKMEKRKIVYQQFLIEFSEPLSGLIGLEEFKKVTKLYLIAALNAAEFGNLRLPGSIKIDLTYPALFNGKTPGGRTFKRPLWTLQDFIEAILNARLGDIGSKQSEYLTEIQRIGVGDFGLLLSKTLLEQKTN
jgi:hypothetical protein